MRRGKGLGRTLRGQACLHNDDGEQAISEGKRASKSSFRCMLIVFIHDSYVDEGAIWRRLDGHLVRVTVKIADVSWRRTNSEGRAKSRHLRRLSRMQIQKHFITCFFPAILCLRDRTKWLIKPPPTPQKKTIALNLKGGGSWVYVQDQAYMCIQRNSCT